VIFKMRCTPPSQLGAGHTSGGAGRFGNEHLRKQKTENYEVPNHYYGGHHMMRIIIAEFFLLAGAVSVAEITVISGGAVEPGLKGFAHWSGAMTEIRLYEPKGLKLVGPLPAAQAFGFC
jgi:hypothetical protein